MCSRRLLQTQTLLPLPTFLPLHGHCRRLMLAPVPPRSVQRTTMAVNTDPVLSLGKPLGWAAGEFEGAGMRAATTALEPQSGKTARQLAERAAAAPGAAPLGQQLSPSLQPLVRQISTGCSLSVQGIHTRPPWAASAPAMPTSRWGSEVQGSEEGRHCTLSSHCTAWQLRMGRQAGSFCCCGRPRWAARCGACPPAAAEQIKLSAAWPTRPSLLSKACCCMVSSIV